MRGLLRPGGAHGPGGRPERGGAGVRSGSGEAAGSGQGVTPPNPSRRTGRRAHPEAAEPLLRNICYLCGNGRDR